MHPDRTPRFTRRTVLRAGGGLAAMAALSPYGQLVARAQGLGMRGPSSLPDPSRPAGTPGGALPFDHIVFVMMENHSFDNYLGMLPRRGQPLADGFTFDAAGRPVNSNPVKGGSITVQRAPSLCQPSNTGSQSWNDTHRQIDGGRMDGFAGTGPGSLVYWEEADLPFYYSLAKTFCLANRWFGSAPCQTYPNRRFLMAGTAFGDISTDTSTVMQYPPNGTIWDRLSAHGIPWRDYYSDVPTAAIIFDTVKKYPQNMVPISQFYADCAAGTLPAVSMVDSDIGATAVAGGALGGTAPAFQGAGDYASTGDQDEENPGDISLGENFVSQVVNAVLGSPLWPRVLLVWLYDEHGGYYDHVPPPRAIVPDAIKPNLGPKDLPGGYDLYGPRVPAVVVSGHARPNAVTNVVHDHTSILATISAKWNLPALTYRDANAATLADFLSDTVTFPEPPALAAPSDSAAAQEHCSTAAVDFPVRRTPTGPARARRDRFVDKSTAEQVVVRFLGRRHGGHGVVVELHVTAGRLGDVEVELRHGRHVVARSHVARLEAKHHRVVLAPRHGCLGAGRYELRVRHRARTLVDRRVRVS